MSRPRIIVGRRVGDGWWLGMSRTVPRVGCLALAAGLVPLLLLWVALYWAAVFWPVTVPALVLLVVLARRSGRARARRGQDG